MTRDQLEALIRRELTAIRNVNQLGIREATRATNTAVDTILTAADGYAAGWINSAEMTAERRDELAAAFARSRKRGHAFSMHLQATAVAAPACGVQGVCTTARGEVTCGRCKDTRAWREAA